METFLLFAVAILGALIGPLLKEVSLRRERATLAELRNAVPPGVLPRYREFMEQLNTLTGALSVLGLAGFPLLIQIVVRPLILRMTGASCVLTPNLELLVIPHMITGACLVAWLVQHLSLSRLERRDPELRRYFEPLFVAQYSWKARVTAPLFFLPFFFLAPSLAVANHYTTIDAKGIHTWSGGAFRRVDYPLSAVREIVSAERQSANGKHSKAVKAVLLSDDTILTSDDPFLGATGKLSDFGRRPSQALDVLAALSHRQVRTIVLSPAESANAPESLRRILRTHH